jgi:hypothetical protein
MQDIVFNAAGVEVFIILGERAGANAFKARWPPVRLFAPLPQIYVRAAILLFGHRQ